MSVQKNTLFASIFFFHTVCQYIFFSFCTGIGKCWYASTKKNILYWHEDRDFYHVHKDTVRATTEDFKYQILAQPFDEKALEAFNNCLRIIPDDALLTSLENTSMFKKIFCSTRSLNDDSCLLFV
jgi:hypothetical protein